MSEESASALGAGAPDIEITPSMIEAGIMVVRGYEPWFSLSPGLEELLVEEILKAASRDARIKDEKMNCKIKFGDGMATISLVAKLPLPQAPLEAPASLDGKPPSPACAQIEALLPRILDELVFGRTS